MTNPFNPSKVDAKTAIEQIARSSGFSPNSPNLRSLKMQILPLIKSKPPIRTIKSPKEIQTPGHQDSDLPPIKAKSPKIDKNKTLRIQNPLDGYY